MYILCLVHNANCFGAQCQYSCDDDEFATDGIFNGTCGGNLFCLPDPYGCSCSPGYRGLGCDEGECEYVVSQHTSEEAATSGLTLFKLIARHHKNTPSSKVTHISFVRLELSSKLYKLQNQLVFVDDIRVTTPYISDEVTIVLRPDGAIGQAATLCGRKWSAINDCEPVLPVDGCLENIENKAAAQDLCSIMNDIEGTIKFASSFLSKNFEKMDN
ncbi:Angiopoietin-1 receptor [Holothuria leucospilota]|uniref:Angiopoietin-1 receptor n=1 Tax=Holothuria leucospilota TaxID=206669 RepID=A0A9Q1BT46_HOLLE|nr:Angiopoietin-1 receptor [Holothuria leucospilota]